MTTPIIYTFMKAQERHNFLEQTVGPIPQETESLVRLKWLAIIAPTAVLILVPIQLLLIYLYNRMGHPWCNFFQQFNEEYKENEDLGVRWKHTIRKRNSSLMRPLMSNSSLKRHHL